jgi:hypothetical protein
LRILAKLLALVWGLGVSLFAFNFLREGDASAIVLAAAFLPFVVALIAVFSDLYGGALLVALGAVTLITSGWYLAQHVHDGKLMMLPVMALALAVPVFAGWVLLTNQEVRHPYRIHHSGGHH